MSGGRVDRLKLGSIAAVIVAIVLALLSRPGEQALTSDPRTAICGADCFPVSHPWLLILAAVLAIAGLIGLRKAYKSTGR
ncbi:hypothetical protein [Novosphingobium sp. 9U]|uniref:hypothetical protein n=1 Tax=Novosphingobium sp. 9U TaxID=2653158 RepID=UPI0012F16221|nr:hypothetical protein [Novosphingobium sp. 9U]VWX51828.1 hypothetical protein NOVOSPHI9U_40417 [Novosphingobium sp. 9U]